VARGPHRADIVGNCGVVIELQHSPISALDIAAREAHYGDMVWLFDATHRFASMKSGERAFFSFGQTKHLDLCKKPVFLDFGFNVVQVDCFTDAVTMVSGFGLIRTREWFAEAFLSNVRQPSSCLGRRFTPVVRESYPWEKKSPVWKLKYPTKWVDPTTGNIVTFRKRTEYIEVNHYTYTVGDSQNKQLDHDKLIELHPEIANGWTKEGLRQMKEFFYGTAILLGGLLRLLPLPAAAIPVKRTVSATQHLLRLAEDHIQAGRLPILKPSTKEGLLEKARRAEISQYGQLWPDPAKPGGAQPMLFE